MVYAVKRRGLSEIVGGLIITIIVVGSIVVASTVLERSLKVAKSLEDSNTHDEISVYPYIVNQTLRLYMAPIVPGHELKVLVISENGTIINVVRVEANRTTIDIPIIKNYKCTPIYIIVVDMTSGQIYTYYNNENIKKKINPKLYVCPSEEGGTTILDPITGMPVQVIPLQVQGGNVTFKPANDTIIIRIYGYIKQEQWNGADNSIAASLVVKVTYNGTQQSKVLRLGGSVKFNISEYNVTVFIYIEKYTRLPVLIVKIDGHSNYYIVNFSERLYISDSRGQVLPFGIPNSTVALLPAANICKCTLKPIKYYFNHGTNTIYNYKVQADTYVTGIMMTNGIFAPAYWVTRASHLNATLTLKLNIIGKLNITEIPVKATYLGKASPGDTIIVKVKSLLFDKHDTLWQYATYNALASVQNNAIPLYIILINESTNDYRYIMLNIGENIININKYYNVYLGYLRNPYFTIAATSWNILHIESLRIFSSNTENIIYGYNLWAGNSTWSVPVSPISPPYMLSYQAGDTTKFYIINFVVNDSRAGEYDIYVKYSDKQYDCEVYRYIVQGVIDKCLTYNTVGDISKIGGRQIYSMKYYNNYLNLILGNNTVLRMPLFEVYIAPGG